MKHSGFKDLIRQHAGMLSLGLVVLLAGCAGQTQFMEGKRLLQENKIIEGLSLLQ
jgi:hypothetical protein